MTMNINILIVTLIISGIIIVIKLTDRWDKSDNTYTQQYNEELFLSHKFVNFKNIVLLIIIMNIFSFLSENHIIFNKGNIVIIRKHHMAIQNTFVDLETFIDKVNNPVIYKDDSMNYLVNELRKRRILGNE